MNMQKHEHAKRRMEMKKSTWWFSVNGGTHGFGPVDLGFLVGKRQAEKEIRIRFNLKKGELKEVWPGKY